MELSKRLQAIAGLVTPGRIIADIGTDHAYIPIYLIQSGAIPFAYAMDINAGPLQRAKEHVMQEHLQEKIRLRLSDGLVQLECGEADCLVIAGMGGALTVRILSEGKEKLQGIRELILEPQSEVFRVREWISRNGFVITDEEMVEEEGKFYPVIKAEKRIGGSVSDSVPGTVSAECVNLYGPVLLTKKHPVLKRYLEKEEKTCSRILGQILKNGAGERNTERIGELEKRMERIREAQRCFRTE